MKRKGALFIIVLLILVALGGLSYLLQDNTNTQKEVVLYGGYQSIEQIEGAHLHFVFDENNDFAMYKPYFEGFSGKYYLVEGQRYLLEFNNDYTIEIELFEDCFYFPIEIAEGKLRMIKIQNISKIPTFIISSGDNYSETE